MSLEDKRRILEKLVEESKKGVIVNVYVKPGSPEEKLVIEGDELVFYTPEIPEKGRANAALTRFFTRILGVPGSRIDIVYGVRSRLKRILIADASRDEIVEKLLQLLGSQ